MMPGYGPIMKALMIRRRGGMPMVNPPMIDEDMVRQPPPGGADFDEMVFPGGDMDYEQQEQRLAQPQLVHSRGEAEQMFGTPRGKPLPPGVEGYTRGMERLRPHTSDPMMGKAYEQVHKWQEGAIKRRMREQAGLKRRQLLGEIQSGAKSEEIEQEAGERDMLQELLDAVEAARRQREGQPRKK